MTYTIIAILAGAGLLLLWLALWLNREHLLGRAILCGVAGVALLAATAVRVTPMLLDRESERLRERITALDKETQALRADKARLAAENAAAATRLKDTEARHKASLATLLGDIAEARSVLSSTDGVVLVPLTGPQPEDQAERARAEIRHLKTTRANPIPLPPPASPVVTGTLREPDRADRIRELSQLRDKMAARMTTPNYDVEAYPDRELIKGRLGRYYVVDMKNAMSGIRYYFEGGKYTLPRGSQEFRTSLNAFVSDILSKFEGQVRYDLYVRGSADAKPYTGQFEAGHEIRSIKLVKSLGNDRYGRDMLERVIEGPVRNQDLPDLRAAFMQRIVAETYPLKPPTVLEGAVTPNANDRDRNVELFLYVDW